ncbi:hypothetical protein ACNOYE_15045 [Nannocystaceae bacterium ST9]
MPRRSSIFLLAPLLACKPPVEAPPPSQPEPIVAAPKTEREVASETCYASTFEWNMGDEIFLGALRIEGYSVVLTTSPDPRVVRRWNEATPDEPSWFELPLTEAPLGLRSLPVLSDPPAFALVAETSRDPILLEIPVDEPARVHSLPDRLVPIAALRGREGQLVHVGRDARSLRVIGPAGSTTLTATCPSLDDAACVIATSRATIEGDHVLALRILSDARDELHLVRITADGSLAWERELDDLPRETDAWGPGEAFGPALLRVEPTRVLVVHATRRIFVRYVDPASGTTRALAINDPPTDSWQTAWTPIALTPIDEGYAIVTRHFDEYWKEVTLGVVEVDDSHAKFGAPSPFWSSPETLVASLDESHAGMVRLYVASVYGENRAFGSWRSLEIDPKCVVASAKR